MDAVGFVIRNRQEIIGRMCVGLHELMGEQFETKHNEMAKQLIDWLSREFSQEPQTLVLLVLQAVVDEMLVSAVECVDVVDAKGGQFTN